MSVESLCVHEVDIIRKVRVRDGKGGMPETDSTVYSSAKARIRPTTPQEAVRFGALSSSITHIIYMADGGLDICSADEIHYEGRVFTVRGPAKNVDELGRYLIVMAEETTRL